jgi:PAS domain S-box-containing protein
LPDQKERHIKQVRKEGFPSYNVFPQGIRDEYTSVVYLEPFAGRNLYAFGYDMFSEQVRRAAMEQARDTGAPVISGKIVLFREPNETSSPSGFLLYTPIFRNDRPVATEEERRAALLGYVFGVFNMKDLMSGLFGSKYRDLNIHIYDGAEVSSAALLYGSEPGLPSRFSSRTAMEVAGHHWVLVVDSPVYTVSGAESYHPTIILIGGITAGLLLFALIRSMAMSRARAFALAEHMSADYRASLEHYQKLFDEGADAIVLSDTDTGEIIDLNQSMERLSGWNKAELVGLSRKVLAPPDFEPVTEGQSIETQLITKGGNIRKVEIKASSLNINGRRALISFLRDITEYKLSMARIDRLTNLYRALSEVNQAIIRMDDESTLFPLLCRMAVDLGGAKMAWVGQLNEANGLIEPVASLGSGTEYLNEITISSKPDVREGRGPSAIAFRENRNVVIEDFLMSDLTKPWHEPALRYDFRSSVSLPIPRGGKPFAVFTIYQSHPDEFDAEAINLLDEMARDISFALHNFDQQYERKQYELGLFESNELMERIFANVSMQIAYMDADFNFIRVNDAYAMAAGNLPEYYAGRNYFELFPNADNKQIFGAVVASGHHYTALAKAFVSENNREHGVSYWDWNVQPVMDRQGQVTGIVVSLLDRTEEMRAQETLRLYARALEASTNSIFIVDATMPELPLIYVNPAFTDMTGYSAEEALGRNPGFLQGGDQEQPELENIRRAVREKVGAQAVLRNYRKDGSLFWNELYVSPVANNLGELTHFIGVARDITLRREIEQDLQESRTQLRGLLSSREAAREEERKYIAREIHDELGQVLTGLQLKVSVLNHRYSKDFPLLREPFQETLILADKALGVARNVASALRPAVLDMGIVSALEWLSGRFAQDTGIQCEMCIANHEIQLEENQAIALFRIVQESLTNVARHAKADKVVITLGRDADNYILKIRDDGVGFDTSEIKTSSFGLVGIRERAMLLGGTFFICSQPGSGTEIVMNIPINNNTRES